MKKKYLIKLKISLKDDIFTDMVTISIYFTPNLFDIFIVVEWVHKDCGFRYIPSIGTIIPYVLTILLDYSNRLPIRIYEDIL